MNGKSLVEPYFRDRIAEADGARGEVDRMNETACAFQPLEGKGDLKADTLLSPSFMGETTLAASFSEGLLRC